VGSIPIARSINADDSQRIPREMKKQQP